MICLRPFSYNSSWLIEEKDVPLRHCSTNKQDGINRFTLYSNRMMFRKMEDNDSHCVTLSLRYRFNVTPSKYKGTGAGNSEKNRL